MQLDTFQIFSKNMEMEVPIFDWVHLRSQPGPVYVAHLNLTFNPIL